MKELLREWAGLAVCAEGFPDTLWDDRSNGSNDSKPF